MHAIRNYSSDSVSLLRRATAAMALLAGAIFASTLCAQTSTSVPDDPPFPGTEELLAQVAQDQKRIESLLTQYTFTDKTTVYTLDKSGRVRSQHTDTYYLTPTAYEFFSLHVSHDGKAVSQKTLDEQQRKIQQRMEQDERKAQKNQTIHPKNQMLFSSILARSNFTPVRWEQVNGLNTVVYSFGPKSTSSLKGSLPDRIAGDLKGKMWISPDEKEILRIEFASVSSLSLGVLGNVKGFHGITEQEKIHGELWMPTRQEYIAEGRELLKGFRIREVSEFSEYLKATTDVFQQIHPPTALPAQPVP